MPLFSVICAVINDLISNFPQMCKVEEEILFNPTN